MAQPGGDIDNDGKEPCVWDRYQYTHPQIYNELKDLEEYSAKISVPEFDPGNTNYLCSEWYVKPYHDSIRSEALNSGAFDVTSWIAAVSQAARLAVGVMKHGTASRCPTRFKLINNPQAKKPLIKVNGETCRDEADLTNKTLHVMKKYEEQKIFAEDIIEVRIESSQVPELTFVDLPGLIKGDKHHFDMTQFSALPINIIQTRFLSPIPYFAMVLQKESMDHDNGDENNNDHDQKTSAEKPVPLPPMVDLRTLQCLLVAFGISVLKKFRNKNIARFTVGCVVNHPKNEQGPGDTLYIKIIRDYIHIFGQMFTNQTFDDNVNANKMVIFTASDDLQNVNIEYVDMSIMNGVDNAWSDRARVYNFFKNKQANGFVMQRFGTRTNINGVATIKSSWHHRDTYALTTLADICCSEKWALGLTSSLSVTRRLDAADWETNIKPAFPELKYNEDNIMKIINLYQNHKNEVYLGRFVKEKNSEEEWRFEGIYEPDERFDDLVDVSFFYMIPSPRSDVSYSSYVHPTEAKLKQILQERGVFTQENWRLAITMAQKQERGLNDDDYDENREVDPMDVSSTGSKLNNEYALTALADICCTGKILKTPGASLQPPQSVSSDNGASDLNPKQHTAKESDLVHEIEESILSTKQLIKVTKSWTKQPVFEQHVFGDAAVTVRNLPETFRSTISRRIEGAEAQIKFALVDGKQRNALIQCQKTPWDKIKIYNKTTRYGMNLIMTKEDFVKGLKQFADEMDEENVDLVPIIRCKDDVFHVQMAWIVELAPNRNIAIALGLNEGKLMVHSIYLDINDVHKLAHAERSCKCLSNFKCDIDRLQIGESEAMRTCQGIQIDEFDRLRKEDAAVTQQIATTCEQLQNHLKNTQMYLESLLQTDPISSATKTIEYAASFNNI